MLPLISSFRHASRSSAVVLTSKLIFLAMFLTLTSGCGLYHFVFYPPTDCACGPENMIIAQHVAGDDPEDESEVNYENEESALLAHEHPEADDDHDHENDYVAAAHGDEDEEEEGDENEQVADIKPGDLKSLGDAETDEGTSTARRVPGNETPAELHEQAARLERAYQIVDVVEASAKVDVSSSDKRRAAEQKFGVSLPSNAKSSVMTGDFFREQDNVAIVTPGNSIKIYAGGRLAAQRPLEKQEDSNGLEELTTETAMPVRLVQNGALQILVHTAQTQPDGAILYNAQIYKVFGNEIGLIFDQTIARRDAKDKPLQKLGHLDFLHGMNHRFIRWTPVDENQKPATEAIILRWNRWEGTYRVPALPPTAPKNQS